MLLGTGKAVITPPVGTPLAGFGFRDHGAESVCDDLEVRVFWLSESSESISEVCIITADLIGFGAGMTERIRSEVQLRFGLPPERLLLAASHTHSGPQTQESMVATGEIVPFVLVEIETRIYAAIAQARSALHLVSMHFGTGECSGYAINRRKNEDGIFLNAPNPGGILEDTVSVVTFRDAVSNAVRAALFHFTCHPTTMGDYAITSDYPGAARRHIEAEFGGEIAAGFLPGCFGDVRPNCALIGGKRFRKGTGDDLSIFGNALGSEVVRLLESELVSLSTRLSGKNSDVEIDLQSHPDQADLVRLTHTDSRVQKEWAARLLEVPFSRKRTLTLQRLDLAVNLSIIAMGGEICCEFGHHIRKMIPNNHLLPLGYPNGLLGYICPSAMYAEGGYEPDESTIYFGLPSAFKPETEKSLLGAIKTLLTDSV